MLAQLTTLSTCALFALLMAGPALAHNHEQPPAASFHHAQPQDAVAAATQEASPLSWQLGSARFTLSGLVEVEQSYSHQEGGGDQDDLLLSTVEIGLEAELTSWLSGRLVGLWEQNDTEPMEVDQAVLTLTCPSRLGGQTQTLHLGRQYLPFGRFATGMISDPLALDLGETRTTAALYALEGERWSLSVGGFTGAVDDGDDGLDSWVAALTVTPRPGMTFGASWLSDLAESDAGLVQEEGLYDDDVPGWSAFIALSHGGFGLNAEYLAAAGSFKSEQVAAGEDLTGRRPRTWSIEGNWQATEQLALVARYEKADDYQNDQRRIGLTAGYALCDFATLSLEYLRGKADGENPDHSVTAQLALSF